MNTTNIKKPRGRPKKNVHSQSSDANLNVDNSDSIPSRDPLADSIKDHLKAVEEMSTINPLNRYGYLEEINSKDLSDGDLFVLDRSSRVHYLVHDCGTTLFHNHPYIDCLMVCVGERYYQKYTREVRLLLPNIQSKVWRLRI